MGPLFWREENRSNGISKCPTLDEKIDGMPLSDKNVQYIYGILCLRRLSLLQWEEAHQFCLGWFFPSKRLSNGLSGRDFLPAKLGDPQIKIVSLIFSWFGYLLGIWLDLASWSRKPVWIQKTKDTKPSVVQKIQKPFGSKIKIKSPRKHLGSKNENLLDII